MEPVRVGVPISRTACRNLDRCRILDASGGTVQAQARMVDRWPDGSARWLLVDFLANTGAAPHTTRYTLHLDSSPSAPLEPDGGPALTITEDERRIAIATGVATFTMRRGGRFPFESVVAARAPAMDLDRSSLQLLDSSGRAHQFVQQTLVVEASGPVRGIVRIDGVFSSTKLISQVRLHFFAGSATVRFDVMIRNPRRARHSGGCWDLGDPGSVLFEDLSLLIGLRPESLPVAAQCSAEPSAPLEPLRVPLEIYQDSSGGTRWDSANHVNRDGRVPLTFRGYRLRSAGSERFGDRAVPIVTLSDGVGREMSVCIPQFWQNFPKALEVSSDGMAVRLFPKQHADVYELQGGEQKCHTVAVTFGSDSVSESPLEWVRTPLHVSSTPEYYAASDAVPYLLPEDQDTRAGYLHLVRSAIEGDESFERKRERIDEYGWRNFGDVYGDHEAVLHRGPQPLVSHWNNQYDTVAASAIQFLRSADLRWWRMHVEMATHVRDIDIYHTDRDKSAYNNGLFWHTAHYVDAATATHRTYPRRANVNGGGPAAGHTYATGLMMHYFLTGDPLSYEAAVGLAKFVVDMDDGTKTIFRWLSRGDTGRASESGTADYHGPGRGSANSVSALLDGHRLTGDATYLKKAEQLIRRCIHPAEEIACRNLAFIEYRWFYTMFLQTLGKYLNYKETLGQFDAQYTYARASLLHYARWMCKQEYVYLSKPELLEHPTETWAAQEIRKSEVFQLAAYYTSDPIEREEFLDRSNAFFLASIEGLQSKPTRSLCRPAAILMGTGWQQAWFQRYAQATPPDCQVHAAFGSPERFTPQKEIAYRRAIVIGAATLSAAVALAIYTFVAL
jgi:hypothetical protein